MSNLDYEINKELGECYLFMGELDKAEEYYRKAASSEDSFPDPYLGLATIAVQRGKMEDALTLYRKAEALESSDKSLGGMGLVFAEKGDHEAALDSFLSALECNPQNMVVLNAAVQEAHYLSRLPEILPCLENALAVNPELTAVRFALAACLVHIGQQDSACRHLETLLGMEPDNSEAKELYNAIKS